ncbi:MAG: hypothetical protein GW903_02260 [Alphaproteobacteria bacterium]|nr:hypothetical protein [Alphaproteobacteria bacterium]NCQ87795.1 hypothetical protein [Alphaproteobacteria bacterium]NCT05697.1 hypothetical protein [Alphaproteobacteria bacterium]
MVTSVQNGFQQQFAVNKALNPGVTQRSEQNEQANRNPVQNTNDQSQVNQSNRTETSNVTTNVTSAQTSRDTPFVASGTSADRGNSLDITV